MAWNMKWRHFLVGLCCGLSISYFHGTFHVSPVREITRTPATLSLDRKNLVNSIDIHPEVKAVEHKIEDQPVYQGNFTDDETIVKDLYKRVRVLCWILTYPTNLKKKAIHVKNTWAKRCNKVLFMSSVQNDSFPAIGLNVSEGREHLTAKTMQAFEYIYLNHYNDADWFLKADDDTYVIMENLRYMLSDEDSKKPIYFGQKFKKYVRQGYPSGGSGYVISKEALRRYGEIGRHDPKICAKDGGSEDAEIGKCLEKLRVVLKPSTDILKRSRFHCFNAEVMVNAKTPKWYLQYDALGGLEGMENISDYAISFHYITPERMHFLEFLTYHLQAYGVLNRPQKLNIIKGHK